MTSPTSLSSSLPPATSAGRSRRADRVGEQLSSGYRDRRLPRRKLAEPAASPFRRTGRYQGGVNHGRSPHHRIYPRRLLRRWRCAVRPLASSCSLRRPIWRSPSRTVASACCADVRLRGRLGVGPGAHHPRHEPPRPRHRPEPDAPGRAPRSRLGSYRVMAAPACSSMELSPAAFDEMASLLIALGWLAGLAVTALLLFRRTASR